MNYSDLKPKLRSKILMESLTSEKTFRELFFQHWVDKYKPPFVELVDKDSLELPINFPCDLAKHLSNNSISI